MAEEEPKDKKAKETEEEEEEKVLCSQYTAYCYTLAMYRQFFKIYTASTHFNYLSLYEITKFFM